MLQNVQLHQKSLYNLPDNNDQNKLQQVQKDMDTTNTNLNTRICVSAEQMEPLLKKLFTDKEQLLSIGGFDRIPTSDVSWNEAVVAGLKISQQQVWDNVQDTHCITGAVDSTDIVTVHDQLHDRHALTAPGTDSQDDNIKDRVDPDAYMNYITLSDMNPVIEAQMCFQTDELFEGNFIT